MYYGSPIPRGKAQLTALALVFDRIHFPNVQLPYEGVDFEAVEHEARRIEGYGHRDHDTLLVVAMLRILPHVGDLREFCTFTGDFDSIFGSKESPRAHALVAALEEKLWGPRPEGFIPTYQPASHKAIPADRTASLNYASPLFYPAKAMIYAAEKGLPLVNDSGLPVPGLGGDSVKDNAPLLASILALECVFLALPTVPSLSPKEIIALRAELRGSIVPFRAGLLRLAVQLNEGIAKGAVHQDIMARARFLVQTEVAANLEQLRADVERASKPFLSKAFEVVKHAPTLASTYATMGLEMAIAQALAAVGAIVLDQRENGPNAVAARSPMYYLLRLQQVAGERRVF
ncbi:hypothetical protein [Variovorax arabinosiphilus]|uniref:hypothetical protein n=1 Tax=Variovorax arabinosiphilus TaxID=3053498 RepID=UPI00257792D8|nr:MULTISPECIES: hypothetical protein [unclassified Variovorax]MDM0121935.1 hypothetical protein [Variovorax sp. J2L1-78]MDM0131535.1 hypothetical protein [Variovorax sp. J2L1-63]MDM0234698.1 hypothetical protein [Variovorax sp. J2R1-6]